ncbi:hypothetical protein [Xanthomonas campestris]|uniref:hypothetical protein n=1 Tax=Xanthomonas campestris TaxID=339 RepID=UPI004044E9D4
MKGAARPLFIAATLYCRSANWQRDKALPWQDVLARRHVGTGQRRLQSVAWSSWVSREADIAIDFAAMLTLSHRVSGRQLHAHESWPAIAACPGKLMHREPDPGHIASAGARDPAPGHRMA